MKCQNGGGVSTGGGSGAGSGVWRQSGSGQKEQVWRDSLRARSKCKGPGAPAQAAGGARAQEGG